MYYETKLYLVVAEEVEVVSSLLVEGGEEGGLPSHLCEKKTLQGVLCVCMYVLWCVCMYCVCALRMVRRKRGASQAACVRRKHYKVLHMCVCTMYSMCALRVVRRRRRAARVRRKHNQVLCVCVCVYVLCIVCVLHV
jgi:hypothetical protein